jgi:hypothetical protein
MAAEDRAMAWGEVEKSQNGGELVRLMDLVTESLCKQQEDGGSPVSHFWERIYTHRRGRPGGTLQCLELEVPV